MLQGWHVGGLHLELGMLLHTLLALQELEHFYGLAQLFAW
jgi:hypothetical protein